MGEAETMSRALKEEKEKKSPEKDREQKKLSEWKKKWEEAKAEYAPYFERFRKQEMLYDGSSYIFANRTPGSEQPKKGSQMVRNFVWELIESEVDCTIPAAKVTALHEEHDNLAKKIEDFLNGESMRLNFRIINDKNERETYIHGNSYFGVSWDALGGLHKQLGAVEVNAINCRQVTPQPGRDTLNDCDYFFVVEGMTREQVEKKFGVQLPEGGEEETAARERGEEELKGKNHLQSVIHAYYKNEKGGIGKYTWANMTVLEDYDDYLERKERVCKKCGAVMLGERCSVCGGEKFRLQSVEEIEIEMPGEEIVETGIDPVSGETVQSVRQVIKREMVPVYRVRQYPIIMRKNVCRSNTFLGISDVDMIADQQEGQKKYAQKMSEKLLKGGSIVTLPDDVRIETSDQEMKVVRVKTPAQKSLIDVLNMQADVSRDLQAMSLCYDWAKSTIGITDSYQGKYDASAGSGTAKQTSVNQAAGRLESKRVLKHAAYAELYRLMFLFWLAYGSEKACIAHDGIDGRTYGELSKAEFLEKDDAGQWYWNDEFLFDVDTASVNPADRRGMQQLLEQEYAAGMFGDTQQTETKIIYWTIQNKLHHPFADVALEMLARQKEREDAAAMQQAKEQAMMSAMNAADETTAAESEGVYGVPGM